MLCKSKFIKQFYQIYLSSKIYIITVILFDVYLVLWYNSYEIKDISTNLSSIVTVNIDHCPEKYSFHILPHSCGTQNQVLVVVITSDKPSSSCGCDYIQHKKYKPIQGKYERSKKEKTCFSLMFRKQRNFLQFLRLSGNWIDTLYLKIFHT